LRIEEEGAVDSDVLDGVPRVLLHLVFGWSWILLGLLSGTAIGLFFHDEKWLGGYQSWRRRLVRLGHISFLGTGLLNLSFGLTIGNPGFGLEPAARLASMLFLLGAAAMPAVCFLAAWRKPFRHLFFIPVVSLIGGTVGTLVHLVLTTGGR
jgi:hypothetical protein